MRKWNLLSWMLALLLLAGCAGAYPAPEAAESPPGPAQKESAQPAAAKTLETPNLTAARTEARSRPLSEEEILSAYERAVTACGWFERTPLAGTEESQMVDGRVYRRVDARGIETMEDLRTYLRGLFSAEVTERLLATGGEAPMYREFDGALFVSGTEQRRDPCKGEITLEAEQMRETEYAVNVTVELLDDDQVTTTGVECWSFPYVFTDGRWVFTEFRLVD